MPRGRTMKDMLLPLSLGLVLCLTAGTSGNPGETIRITLQKVESIRSTLLKMGKNILRHEESLKSTAWENLRNYLDTQYVGVVSVGSPPQFFNVIFDTAAFLTWIPSVRCKVAHHKCAGLHKYDSSKSVMYIRNETFFFIPYGYGNVTGVLSTDTLTVGGLQIWNQTFGEAIDQYKTFSVPIYDGVLGLGFIEDTAFKVIPPFYHMFQQKLINTRVFSFYMSRHMESTVGGELIFGGTNPRFYEGEINYVHVSNKKYWGFQMNDVMVNGRTLCAHGCHAVMDTATTMIVGPNAEVSHLLNELGVYSGLIGRYQVDCRRIPELPTVIFTINKVKYFLEPEDYIIRYKLPRNLTHVCDVVFYNATHDAEPNMWIFGDAFIRKYYTTFDFNLKRIGFATAVHR